MTLERREQVVTVCLVPPDGKPPTLDHRVLDALDQVVSELAADPPRVTVLRSSSGKYFCVGANLRALQQITPETIDEWVRHGHAVLNALEDLPCPVVARVSGYCLGGGLELAMAADVIHASSDATFGATEAKVGFIPGWGGSRRLVERVGLARAKQCLFTGRTIPADQAEEIGLADCVSAPGELDADIEGWISEILSCSALAIAECKAMLADAGRAARADNCNAEAERSVACVSHTDTQNRLREFFAARGRR